MPEHEDQMRRAIQAARRNPGAPFGAVLVDVTTGEVVVEGVNQTHVNPIAHGEIDAINRYAASGRDGWVKLRIYTTAEPCCMCQAAIIWSGIPEVVFGTSIGKLVELGWNQFAFNASEVAALANFARCDITGGVLANECDALFKQARPQS